MLYSIKNFLKFYFKATTLYNVHSPFVYELINYVFNSPVESRFSERIYIQRKNLLDSNQKIPVIDYGAGSRNKEVKDFDKVSRIASSAVSGTYKSKLLYNLCSYFKPSQMLELGTSLGISAAHMAQAGGKLTTLEGNEHISEFAKKVWFNLNIDNISVINGNFSKTLPEYLLTNNPDLVYLDGNHTYEATMDYFHKLNAVRTEKEMILIFDDIYWSEGMLKAWNEIRGKKEISLSIDLYFYGLIFFKTDTIAPQNYSLLPFKWKPWHIGFKPVK